MLPNVPRLPIYFQEDKHKLQLVKRDIGLMISNVTIRLTFVALVYRCSIVNLFASKILPEMELESRTCFSCKNCAICVHLILSQYNLLTDAYHVIGSVYKFLLCLSITQVSGERSFSTLKFVKNRLRSSLSQDNLEVNVHREGNPHVYKQRHSYSLDKVAETSALLRRLLML